MTLCEVMDRLFDDAFTRPLSMSGDSVIPAIDLYQNADEVLLKDALPGLEAKDVQIWLTKDTLTLRAEFKHETEQKEVTWTS